MYQYAATIERVLDGDTLDLLIDLGFSTFVRARVRLEGLDAPEITTAAGKQVKEWLSGEAARHREACVVQTRKDKREKFGRMLATIQFAGEPTTLNDAMLASGMAKPYAGGKR